MNSFLVSPEQHAAAISIAEAATGIELDTQTLRSSEDGIAGVMAGQDKTGLLDARFQFYFKGRHTPPRPMEPRQDALPFLFNGLLTQRSGVFRIEQTASELDIPLPDSGMPYSYIEAQLISSPRAINHAQVILGRIPGRDAFRISRLPRRGRIDESEWLQGVSRLRIKTADINEWGMSSHDVDPYQHIQSWMLTPPRICLAIAAHARHIMGKHKESLHLLKGDRPKEIDVFTGYLENLEWYTRPLLKSLVRERFSEKRLSAKVLLGELLQEDFQREMIGLRYSTRQLFSGLGLAGPEKSVSQKAMDKIAKEYAVHAAGILLRADAAVPVDSPKRTIENHTIRTMQVLAGAA